MKSETVVRNGNADRLYQAREYRPAWKDKEDGREGVALWALVDRASGVILRYGVQDKIQATAARWNEKPERVPERLRDKAESARALKEMLKPGDTVKTILRSVSRSGMCRRISLAVARNGNVEDITWYVARVTDENVRGRAGRVQDVGITVGGCGMDMGFHLVYNLGRVLWPFGFKRAGKRCVSNAHSNVPGDPRDGRHMHPGDGGYALRQEWL